MRQKTNRGPRSLQNNEGLGVKNVNSCVIIGGGLIATAGALTLERMGRNVTVVTRAPRPLGGDSIVWNYGDVSSSAALHAVTEAESVIYAAGTLGPATEMETVHGAVSDEIIPVLRLAEHAAVSGAKTFVFISSGGTVYGPDAPIPTDENVRTAPINVYGTIKALTEQALLEVGRKYGITVVILRVSNPYGPGQSGTRRMGFIAAAVKKAISGEPIVIWGDGGATRDFIFLEDVGAALAAASDHRGSSTVLNIGSGKEYSLLEVCEIITKNSRNPLDIQFNQGRNFDVPRSCLNISKSFEVLGWKPNISIEGGIAITMANSL